MVPLSDYIEFEEKVTDLISQVLSEGETVISNKVIDKSAGLKPDIYLPKGCSKLRIEPNTIIECVYRLTFDTVSRVESRYLPWIGEKHLLIVFNISSDPGFIVNDRTWLTSFADLKKLAPDINEGSVAPSDWKDIRKKRINNARFDFSQGDITLFLGAGVSIDAKLPSWDDLLKRIEADLNNAGTTISFDRIAKDAGNSTLISARALRMNCEDGYFFRKRVKDALYKTPSQQSDLVDSIVSVIEEEDSRVKSVITYNFDNVLEQNLRKPHCSVTEQNRIDPGKFPIFHVHGFIPENPALPSSKIVFSEESYHDVYKHSYHWSNIEQMHALANTSCCFIGLSMIDPNLRRLLDFASDRDKDVYHYAFLRRTGFKDPDTVDKMLLELHVRVIWFMRFSQLPKMVKAILS